MILTNTTYIASYAMPRNDKSKSFIHTRKLIYRTIYDTLLQQQTTTTEKVNSYIQNAYRFDFPLVLKRIILRGNMFQTFELICEHVIIFPI